MNKQLQLQLQPYNYDNCSEADCIAAAKRGSTEAFDALLNRNKVRLQAHCNSLASCSADAQDIYSATLVKAWAGIRNFKGASKLYTWLHRIAWNTSINSSKRVYRREEISCDFLEEKFTANDSTTFFAEVSKTEAEVENKRTGAAITLAVAKLSEEHKIVFTLYELDGLTHSQIASRIGVPAGTVRSRLHFAKKQLRELLEDFKNNKNI